jgi:hypothetical protein
MALGQLADCRRDAISILGWRDIPQLLDSDTAFERAPTEWEREWSKEIEQRMTDVADNRVELIDADDVHRELRAELRDAGR